MSCVGKDKLIKSLLKCSDKLLGTREEVGVVLYPVFIMTRTWSGKQPGDGSATENSIEIEPSPQIVDYSHDIRGSEAGFIRQGDIILRGVSKKRYPEESLIDCSTSNKKIEKYYLINERFYTVIHVKDKYITWDVHLRKRSDETRLGK